MIGGTLSKVQCGSRHLPGTNARCTSAAQPLARQQRQQQQRRRQLLAPAASDAAPPGVVEGEPFEGGVESKPWQFLFQSNERQLQWDDSAARQLIKIHVADKLGKDVPFVESKLDALAALLPDLVGKMERLKADLVLDLVNDTEGVAQRLVALRVVLPRADLSAMFSKHPALLLELQPDAVAAQLESLRAALPGVDVEMLLDREPLLLRADISGVLDKLARVLPPGSDPVKVLVNDPSIVLDMETAGMPSSEGEYVL